jgi:hypothetical protein
MQDPVQFRKYAEECRRLARTLPPAHQRALLEIADGWIKCAEDAERAQKNPEK